MRRYKNEEFKDMDVRESKVEELIIEEPKEKIYTRQEVIDIFGVQVLDSRDKQEYTIAEIKDIAYRHKVEYKLSLIG